MQKVIARIEQIPVGWYLLVLVALGATVRFWGIAKSSIWHDEGYTLMLAPQAPLEILARTARDVHPPLYYVVLHYWMLVFGSSEVAVRSLSLLCMILVIPLTYLLVRRLFGQSAAQVAALFVTFGPFLVRYGQEARMYAMMALLLLTATYLLVRAVQDGRWRWWLLYAIVVTAALYTHYYSVFIVAVHFLYIALQTSKQPKISFWRSRWWPASGLIAILFLPWLPIAYGQFSRVQGGFWIPSVTATTLPDTILQFFSYSGIDSLPVVIKVALGLGFGILIAINIFLIKQRRANFALMSAYAVVGPLLVFALSFKRPLYVDRYFVFAAVAFYSLLGILIVCGWPLRHRLKAQVTAIGLVLAIFAGGIINVHIQANHQMRTVAQKVSAAFRPGDVLISGELYTYFDFSYYNRTGQLLKLLEPHALTGYGESSLLYDRADQIVVHNYADLHPLSGAVWVVGKTGQHYYFDNVPFNWRLQEHIEAGYIVAQKYQVHQK